MTKNSKGVLGQIEGLKESFEAVLRKRTIYRQQINQLTACLRERNREIKDLTRRVNELQEQVANNDITIEILQARVAARGDLIANQEVEINDLYCSVNEWRDKARALAAELHERGGNGEGEEEPIDPDSGTVKDGFAYSSILLNKTGKSLATGSPGHETPFEPDQDLQARMGGV